MWLFTAFWESNLGIAIKIKFTHALCPNNSTPMNQYQRNKNTNIRKFTDAYTKMFIAALAL